MIYINSQFCHFCDVTLFGYLLTQGITYLCVYYRTTRASSPSLLDLRQMPKQVHNFKEMRVSFVK